MKKLFCFTFVNYILLINNVNASLFYKDESILDIFNFDSEFWSDFGADGLARYYFLIFLLIILFWFMNGLSFLEEKIFKKKVFSDSAVRKTKKRKRKKNKI